MTSKPSAGRRLSVLAVVLSAGGWLAAGAAPTPTPRPTPQPDPRGDNPSAPLLTPEQQRTLFHVPPGFEVQLVAAEPQIQKPLNLNFDSAGRLWVTGSELYPWPARTDATGAAIASFDKNWDDNPVAFRATATPPKPVERGRDTLRVLSDIGVDGRARQVRVFADGLNIPVGIMPLPRRPGAKGDAVIVHSIPSVWRMEDTDGDGQADLRERLYTEFGFRDTHGMVSNFTYWVDGWIYGTHGFANRSEVRALKGPASGEITLLESGNTYRFRPDGSRFERFTWGQTNPFGLTFDSRGDVYTADSHSKPVYLLVRGGFYEGINKQHDGLGFAPPITLDNHGSSAIAGIAAYEATQFPEEYRGNVFNGNPVTRRVNRVRLEWTGSTPNAVRQTDFLTCDDPAFRPVQVKLGPDGALYIADFYNPIIGHYESPLTHPNRDHGHGRIWRVVYHGETHAVKIPALRDFSHAGAAELVELLEDPNLTVRTLASNELIDRIGAPAALSALAAQPGTPTSALSRAFIQARLTEQPSRQGMQALASATQLGDTPENLATLREFGERVAGPDSPDWQPGGLAEQVAAAVVQRAEPGHLWRLQADLLRRQPRAWAAPILLRMLKRAPEADTELVYALRLSLKAQMVSAGLAEWKSWAQGDPASEAWLADVSVAVSAPTSAEFLLEHLRRTAFGEERAGEFARHAVLQLPPERLTEVEPLMRSLQTATLAQRLAFAEGLATVSAVPGRSLPPSVSAWMGEVLLEGTRTDDPRVGRRAIDSMKKVEFPGRVARLGEMALGLAGDGVRTSALGALPPNDPAGLATLRTVVLRPTDSVNFRKQAAAQLGTAPDSAAARDALLAGLPGAPADLTLSIVIALAKSEAGAAKLVEQAEAGRVPATYLRHRYVSAAMEAYSPELRARVAKLTAGLPDEDARLDAIIAQRMSAYATAKRDVTHGAEVFVQNCAVCHRLKNAGGNIGPSLDGIGSRGLARLVEDILDPNRNVDPTFRLVSLTLKNGESKAGLNLRDEGETYLLMDPSTGQDMTVPKSAVASTLVQPNSPMPPAFESALSEKDFFDLLEFLQKP